MQAPHFIGLITLTALLAACIEDVDPQLLPDCRTVTARCAHGFVCDNHGGDAWGCIPDPESMSPNPEGQNDAGHTAPLPDEVNGDEEAPEQPPNEEEPVAVVNGDDPTDPEGEVNPDEAGPLSACPVAIIEQALFRVHPLSIVTLDGSASTDDGETGAPLHYDWIMVQRPAGSQASLIEEFNDRFRPMHGGEPDDSLTPLAGLFIDAAGTYVVNLRVTDEEGQTSPGIFCAQNEASITIHARAPGDIYVEATWDTPEDEDPNDSAGTDVDLHLRHPNALDWFGQNQGGLDCYFANPAPDWGEPGQAGNPSLDIDDTNGAGPEAISLNDPEAADVVGGHYRVGLHYYRSTTSNFGDRGDWSSEVTLRVYVRGVLSHESARLLENTNDFWEVAGVAWSPDSPRVFAVDRLSVISPH